MCESIHTVENWWRFAPQKKTLLKCDQFFKKQFSWEIGWKTSPQKWEFVTEYSILVVDITIFDAKIRHKGNNWLYNVDV